MTRSAEVIAIFGPTASGKSAVAEELAARLGTEVVSADALQVYRGLPVLTNQPATPTRLVAIRDLDAEMSVGEYGALAHAAVDELVESSGSAVVTGGTGLYLRAALVDLGVPPLRSNRASARDWRSPTTRAPLEAHARLQELDPRAAATVHPNDRRRVVRALELAESGSSLIPEDDRCGPGSTDDRPLVVGLEVSSEELDGESAGERRRCSPAAWSTRSATRSKDASPEPQRRPSASPSSLELPPDEALERIVVRTRRYAAYQRKWMRRIPGIVMIDGDRTSTEVADAILEVAGAR